MGGSLEFSIVLDFPLPYIISNCNYNKLTRKAVIVDNRLEMLSKKNIIIIALLLAVLFFSSDFATLFQENAIRKEFEQWIQRYGKVFQNQHQLAYRFYIYKRNKNKVQTHNNRAQQGKSLYFMELNQFAATTEKQYKSQYGKLFQTRKLLNTITLKCNGSINDTPNPPDSVNWTDRAVDKNVKTEGKCAANWAFSAVAAYEGLYAIKMESFIKFSDQQIIDCSGEYGNEGCGGGFMQQTYWYMIDQGLAMDKIYPYANGTTQNCKYSQSQKVGKLFKCARVPSGNYPKLISAVSQQPVTVAVASEKFMLYNRGIFDSDCGIDIDRGMLLVGYGRQGNQDFWILKNTFGPSWGENGYIRLKKKPEEGAGMCGIQLLASVPQNIEG